MNILFPRLNNVVVNAPVAAGQISLRNEMYNVTYNVDSMMNEVEFGRSFGRISHDLMITVPKTFDVATIDTFTKNFGDIVTTESGDEYKIVRGLIAENGETGYVIGNGKELTFAAIEGDKIVSMGTTYETTRPDLNVVAELNFGVDIEFVGEHMTFADINC